jgi:CHAT domain-containing protein
MPPASGDGNDISAAYRDASWLIRRQAVSVLPSVASIKSLRMAANATQPRKPMIGFGDPVFGHERPAPLATTVTSERKVTRSFTDYWKGAGVDRARLSEALPRLIDTALELREVAKKVGAQDQDILLREAASERAVKTANLADYRIVYFATHGLIAGDVKGLAEPSLALTIPATPSTLDDGLLTASEIALLKWCRTGPSTPRRPHV